MIILKEGLVSTDLNVFAGTYISFAEVTRAIREAIISENDATNMYEKIVDTLKNTAKYQRDNKYLEVANLVQNIANEEKKHIGEFTKILSMIDKDDIENYKLGVEEI